MPRLTTGGATKKAVARSVKRREKCVTAMEAWRHSKAYAVLCSKYGRSGVAPTEPSTFVRGRAVQDQRGTNVYIPPEPCTLYQVRKHLRDRGWPTIYIVDVAYSQAKLAVLTRCHRWNGSGVAFAREVVNPDADGTILSDVEICVPLWQVVLT